MPRGSSAAPVGTEGDKGKIAPRRSVWSTVIHRGMSCGFCLDGDCVESASRSPSASAAVSSFSAPRFRAPLRIIRGTRGSGMRQRGSGESWEWDGGMGTTSARTPLDHWPPTVCHRLSTWPAGNQQPARNGSFSTAPADRRQKDSCRSGWIRINSRHSLMNLYGIRNPCGPRGCVRSRYRRSGIRSRGRFLILLSSTVARRGRPALPRRQAVFPRFADLAWLRLADAVT